MARFESVIPIPRLNWSHTTRWPICIYLALKSRLQDIIVLDMKLLEVAKVYISKHTTNHYVHEQHDVAYGWHAPSPIIRVVTVVLDSGMNMRQSRNNLRAHR